MSMCFWSVNKFDVTITCLIFQFGKEGMEQVCYIFKTNLYLYFYAVFFSIIHKYN